MKKLKDILRDLTKCDTDILVIHYACTDIKKEEVQITCISVGDYKTKNTDTFSRRGFSEKELLSKFFEFIKSKSNICITGWNLKDITYGFPVLQRRYRELNGEDIQIKFQNIDIDDMIEQEYGKEYVPHKPSGKMFNLFGVNRISRQYFLPGKDEAEKGEAGEYRPIELSSNTKVRGFMDVLDLIIDNRLMTTNSIKSKIHRLIDKILDSTFYKAIGLFLTALTLGFSAYGIYCLVTN